MIRFWRSLSYGLLALIVVSITIYAVSWKICLYTDRDCVVINRLPSNKLLEKCVYVKLVSSKLIPVINSTYTAHWAVVCVTDKGTNIVVGSSRYMAIFLTEVDKINSLTYHGKRWDERFNVMKSYTVNKDANVYDIAYKVLENYCLTDRTRYSPINHNCHHVAQFIIREFCDVEPGDKFIKEYKGSNMIRKTLTDAFTGPKAFV